MNRSTWQVRSIYGSRAKCLASRFRLEHDSLRGRTDARARAGAAWSSPHRDCSWSRMRLSEGHDRPDSVLGGLVCFEGAAFAQQISVGIDNVELPNSL